MSDRTTRVNLENTSEIIIAPSTEGKQDTIISLLQGLGALGTTLKAGRKTVTTAGTAETLVASTDTLVVGVIIKAFKENTGTVHIGISTVDSSSAKQYELEAGEAISISINDLVKIYVDVSVNGEGVQYIGS